MSYYYAVRAHPDWNGCSRRMPNGIATRRLRQMRKPRKPGKIMFSLVSGRLLLDGRPLVGREIRQSYNWLGVDGGDATTYTDDDYYSFPTVFSYERQPRGEKDVFISQRISTIHEDHTITLWSTTKYEFQDGGELEGCPSGWCTNSA